MAWGVGRQWVVGIGSVQQQNHHWGGTRHRQRARPPAGDYMPPYARTLHPIMLYYGALTEQEGDI